MSLDGAKEKAKALMLPLALLLAFEAWARASHLQSDSLAPPSAIVMALAGAFADLSILTATRDTLFSAFAGLAVGSVIGLALGIAFGISDVLNRLMEVTIEAIRPIPSIALLPIALIALGFGYRMEIVIVAFACVWPILILSRAAVRSIEPRLIEVSRALRLPPAQRVWKIIIPAALPRIFVAFRLSAGIALIVAVTVEIAINPLGLGAGIMLAQQALRPDLMLAYLVWIGAHRLRAEHPAGRRPAPPVRPRRLERRQPMNLIAILWRLASFAVAAGFVALWQLVANLQAGLAGVPARAGPGLGLADARVFHRRSLEQARRHARAHGLWLARRLDRRHRDRRGHRLVAH